MLLFLDVMFYPIYVVTSFLHYAISKLLLGILSIKIVKKTYGKNHKLATEIATSSFEQIITSSERPMSGVIFIIHFAIVNFLLFILPFEINYKEEIYSNFYAYIVLCIPVGILSYYIFNMYTKNDRHKRAIEKFSNYTFIQKLFLFLLSSTLFWSLCGLTIYSSILI
jgi:hypothetical protein